MSGVPVGRKEIFCMVWEAGHTTPNLRSHFPAFTQEVLRECLLFAGHGAGSWGRAVSKSKPMFLWNIQSQ